MDTNNDMKVTCEEFINACVKDEKLWELLEGFIAGLQISNKYVHNARGCATRKICDSYFLYSIGKN